MLRLAMSVAFGNTLCGKHADYDTYGTAFGLYCAPPSA